MRLRVISDGTNVGTKILDAETGKPIDNVFKFKFEIEAGGLGEITLQTHIFDLDLETPELTEQESETIMFTPTFGEKIRRFLCWKESE